MEKLTLTLDELAETLGKAPNTIYQDLHRKPDRVPPPLRVPGTRKLLWLRSDVEAWLRQFTQMRS